MGLYYKVVMSVYFLLLAVSHLYWLLVICDAIFAIWIEHIIQNIKQLLVLHSH